MSKAPLMSEVREESPVSKNWKPNKSLVKGDLEKCDSCLKNKPPQKALWIGFDDEKQVKDPFKDKP
jgi:hypothetical protein